MDLLRAKEILEGLADGVNPLTGEVLADEDPCNQPEVIRALHTALRFLSEKKAGPQPERAGTPSFLTKLSAAMPKLWFSPEDELMRSPSTP